MDSSCVKVNQSVQIRLPKLLARAIPEGNCSQPEELSVVPGTKRFYASSSGFFLYLEHCFFWSDTEITTSFCDWTRSVSLPTGDFEHISLGYDPSISLRRNMEQFGSNLCGHVVSAVAHLCHLNTFLNPIPSKAALAAQLLVLLWARGKTALNHVVFFWRAAKWSYEKGMGSFWGCILSSGWGWCTSCVDHKLTENWLMQVILCTEPVITNPISILTSKKEEI